MRTWPLIGRSAELDAVIRCLDASRSVVIAGPPGVGKTRLAAECLRIAAAKAHTTIRIAGTEAASHLPFGAFASLLPEFAAESDRTDTLRGIGREIASRADSAPTVLLVDDAHFLDPASAVLVHELAAGPDVVVIATVRAREPAPDPVLALWKDGIADRFELRELPESAVDQLLTEYLGGPVQGATRHLLFTRSAGNVLYLRELVLGAVDEERLVLQDGLWQLVGALPSTARLVELIEARLAGLTESERAGVEVLALGEPIDLELLESLIGTDCLRSLERRRLTQVEEEGRSSRVRLVHPLYGDVIRAELPPMRRREVARALADALQAAGAGQRDLLRLASWRMQGGGTVDAALILEAARQAWRLHDLDLAARLSEWAIELGAGFDARVLNAQVLGQSDRADEAEHLLAGLSREALENDAQRVQLAIARIDNLCYNLGRLDAALRVAEDLEIRIEDQAKRDTLTASRASLLDTGGRTTAMLAAVLPVVGRGTGESQVWACVMAAWGLARTGQITRAIEVAARGLTVYRTIPDARLPWGLTPYPALHSWALLFRGDLAVAETAALAEYERGLSERSGETEVLLGQVLAMICIAQGRPLTATRWAGESVTVLRGHGRLIQLRSALCTFAEARVLLGDADGAAAALDELDRLPIPFVTLMESEVLRVRAWLAATTGGTAEAARLFERAIELAHESGDLVWESTAAHDLARCGHPDRVLRRLEELAAEIEGPLATARAGHVQALVDRDPDALARSSATFAELGANLLAAESAQDAAVAFTRAGDPRRAAAQEHVAAELAELCEHARTPALGAATVRASLSPRELEIAQLAAAGAANRDIADQLHLSLRTVENKLSVAYQKLGIGGRKDLASALWTSTSAGSPNSGEQA